MKIVSREKFKMVAEVKGWSTARAQGYVDGEVSRKHGRSPSRFALVGMDEYCLGFRAGFFDREHAGSESQVVVPQGR
jgi:hypothetical protein